MIGKPEYRTAGLVQQCAMLHLCLGVAFCVLYLASAPAYGQMPSTDASQNSAGKSEAKEFEVATIKPAATTDRDGPSFVISPNGMVKITNLPLKTLILAAYDLEGWQVTGGPGWIDSDSYDVEAKPPDPSDGVPAYNIHHGDWTVDDPKLRAMLQALLEDRFQLKTHLIVKKGPVHVLERSDRELTLTPSKHPLRGGRGGIGFARGVGLLSTTMPQFTQYLSLLFRETVIDKTGLTGQYDFRSKTVLTPEDLPPSSDSADILNLFLPAIKEMGLKLARSTGPVTTLVIDSAARPSAN